MMSQPLNGTHPAAAPALVAAAVAPAAATPEVQEMPPRKVMGSVRDVTEQIQQAFQQSVDQHRREEALKRRPTGKPAAPKPAGQQQRRQTAEVVGTTMPPPRVEQHVRASLESPELVKKLEELAKIAKLQEYLTRTTLSEEDIKNGITLLTPEKRVEVENKIAEIKQSIIDQGLDKVEPIRIAKNASPAIAAFLDWVVLQIFDLAANNTLATEHKVVELKYIADPESIPDPARGGLRISDSAAAPFLSHYSTFVNYSREKEDLLNEERREAQKEKSEAKKQAELKAAQAAAHAAAQAAAAQAAALAQAADAAGGDVTTAIVTQAAQLGAQIQAASAAPAPQVAPVALAPQAAPAAPAPQAAPAAPAAKAAKPPQGLKKTPPGQFTSYIQTLLDKHGKKMHPSYEKIRIATRFKEHLNELLCLLLKSLGPALRAVNGSGTISAERVASYLESIQLLHQRPAKEITSLKTVINDTLARWTHHCSREEERKKQRNEEKFNKMPAEEKEALLAKKRLQEQERLASSLKSQEARAQKAQVLAEKKRAALAELSAAAPAAAVTPGVPIA